MKIKLLANNITWPTLNERVVALTNKLSAQYATLYKTITVDVVDTTLEIPAPDANGLLDASWFQKNIIDPNGTYDAYILLINRSRDWKAPVGSEAAIILGQYIQSGETLNFYLVADENQTVVENDLKTYNVFEDTFEHEFAHAVYHDLHCPLKNSSIDQVYIHGTDNVHYFTYAAKHNWPAMYADIFSIDKQKVPGISPNSTTFLQTIDSLIKHFQTLFAPHPSIVPTIPASVAPATIPGAPASPKKDYITLWAKEAQQREGYYVDAEYPQGTPAYRNCNPGNIEYGPYAVSLGAISANGRFAVFANYQAGFNALCQFFRDACSGRLASYKPTMTMYDFYAVYAPSGDNNDPTSYANQVIAALGITPVTEIHDLL